MAAINISIRSCTRLELALTSNDPLHPHHPFGEIEVTISLSSVKLSLVSPGGLEEDSR